MYGTNDKIKQALVFLISEIPNAITCDPLLTVSG
jgi:hypothetical protein